MNYHSVKGVHYCMNKPLSLTLVQHSKNVLLSSVVAFIHFPIGKFAEEEMRWNKFDHERNNKSQYLA